MNKDNENYSSMNYVFHIQSAEDFYNQLKSLYDELPDEDVENCDLAISMLRDIGIECNK